MFCCWVQTLPFITLHQSFPLIWASQESESQFIALLLTNLTLILRLSAVLGFVFYQWIMVVLLICLIVGFLHLHEGCGWITLEEWGVGGVAAVLHYKLVLLMVSQEWESWYLLAVQPQDKPVTASICSVACKERLVGVEEISMSSHTLQLSCSSLHLMCNGLVVAWCSMGVEKAVALHHVCNSVDVSHEVCGTLGNWAGCKIWS